MQRLKQNLFIGAGLTVLGMTGLFMNSAQVAAQNPHPGSAPVNIVSPLPLPVTGSLSVSDGTVAVSGTVNVRDVDRTVRTPFHATLSNSVPSFAVEASQSLTIEFVTSECTTQQDAVETAAGTDFLLRTSVRAEAESHNFHPRFTRIYRFPQPSTLVNTYYGSTDMARIYADPGTTVRLGGIIEGFFCSVSVSGYTVPS